MIEVNKERRSSRDAPSDELIRTREICGVASSPTARAPNCPGFRQARCACQSGSRGARSSAPSASACSAPPERSSSDGIPAWQTRRSDLSKRHETDRRCNSSAHRSPDGLTLASASASKQPRPLTAPPRVRRQPEAGRAGSLRGSPCRRKMDPPCRIGRTPWGAAGSRVFPLEPVRIALSARSRRVNKSESWFE